VSLAVSVRNTSPCTFCYYGPSSIDTPLLQDLDPPAALVSAVARSRRTPKTGTTASALWAAESREDRGDDYDRRARIRLKAGIGPFRSRTRKIEAVESPTTAFERVGPCLDTWENDGMTTTPAGVGAGPPDVLRYATNDRRAPAHPRPFRRERQPLRVSLPAPSPPPE